MTMNRFGEIPINPDAKQGRPGKKKQDPEALPDESISTHSSEPDLTEEEPEAAPEVKPAAEFDREPAPEPAAQYAAEPEAFGKPSRARTARKKKQGGKRWVLRAAAWLVAVPLCMVLLYAVGSYLFVPFYIKGPLARSLGQRLERPVEISRAVFSPFTLRLFLENITIGPVAGDRSEQRLLECARIDCRITPRPDFFRHPGLRGGKGQ